MKKSNLNIAYSFQAVLILFWWIGIVQNQEFYSLFKFDGLTKDVFYSFLIPDVIAIALPSIILIYKELAPLKHIVLGGFIYATIFCITSTLRFGGGEISSILMLFGTVFNVLLCFKTDFFRQSSSNNNMVNLLKTGVQIVFVWSIFLIIIPFFILKLESKIPLPIEFNLRAVISILLFLLFSSIGLWSGYTLSVKGKGTPLPVDATKNLVVTGPYAFVRNPMAICGIGQGLSIALFTRSSSIAIYCLIGIFAWHFVVRKYEEEDLLLKFGEDFNTYRNSIKCWIPSLQKYKSRP